MDGIVGSLIDLLDELGLWLSPFEVEAECVRGLGYCQWCAL